MTERGISDGLAALITQRRSDLMLTEVGVSEIVVRLPDR